MRPHCCGLIFWFEFLFYLCKNDLLVLHKTETKMKKSYIVLAIIVIIATGIFAWFQGSFSTVMKGNYELLYLCIPAIILAFLYAN